MKSEVIYTLICIIDSKVIPTMNVEQRGKFLFLTDLTGIRIAGKIGENTFVIKNNVRKKPIIKYGIFK